MIEQWVVQIEMVGDVETGMGRFSFDGILWDLADCSPALLRSPGRHALVLRLPARTALDAHLIATKRWQQAASGSFVQEWRIVRVEVLTVAEFEREWRTAEREEGLALEAYARKDAETLADRLLRDVFEDPLTHLPTQEAFRVHLQLVLNRQQQDDGMRHAVIAVDLKSRSKSPRAEAEPLDDLLLLAAAERASGLIRGGDVVARLDGDTLALLVKDIRDENVEPLAERIFSALSEQGESSSPPWCVSGIGIALSSRNSDADRLLAAALAALNSGGGEGEGRFTVLAGAEQLTGPPSDLYLEHSPDSADGV